MHKEKSLREILFSGNEYFERYQAVREQIEGKQDERYEKLVRRFALEYMKRGRRVDSALTVSCRLQAAELFESLRVLREALPKEAEEILETAVEALLEIEDWEDAIVSAVRFGLRVDLNPFDPKTALSAFGVPIPDLPEQQKQKMVRDDRRYFERDTTPEIHYYGVQRFEDLVRAITKSQLERGVNYNSSLESAIRHAAGKLYKSFEDTREAEPDVAEQALIMCADTLSMIENDIDLLMIASRFAREIEKSFDCQATVNKLCEEYKGVASLETAEKELK